MEQVKQKIHVDALLNVASSVNNNLSCTASPTLQGGMNLIVPIAFSDGTTWSARIPCDAECSSVETMKFTARLMRFLEDCMPDIPAPRLKKLCTESNDDCLDVGAPYLLMTWIKGQTVIAWSPQFPALRKRLYFLDQIARLHCYLITQSHLMASQAESRKLFDRSDKGVSTTEWFLQVVDRRIARVLDGSLPSSEGDLYARFLVRGKVLAGTYIIPNLDTSDYVLHHDDLNRLNILVEDYDDWKISGILDWDVFTRWIPLQAACRFPSIISYAASGHDQSLYSQDRSHYINAFRQAEIEKKGGSEMAEVLANEELQFFQESLWHQRQLYPLFVKIFFTSLAEDDKIMGVIQHALDDFLERTRKYEGHELVTRLRSSLTS